jgi:hypothetical protein
MVILGSIHVFFPRYFSWKQELRNLSPINRQMMYVHTLFIALTVFLMGVLCLTSADDLVSTPLGRTITLGLAIFWTIRLLIQAFGYSSELWRGKLFETFVHILFCLIWIFLSAVFIFAWAS